MSGGPRGIAVALLLGLVLPVFGLDPVRDAPPAGRSGHLATDDESSNSARSAIVAADGEVMLVGKSIESSPPPQSDLEEESVVRHSGDLLLAGLSTNATSIESELEIIWTGMENWAIICGVLLVFVLADSFFLEKFSHTGLGHIGLVVFWIAVGLVYNLVVFLKHGEKEGYQWSVGYLLEWMLSFDNLFVFHMIFKHFKVPEHLKHKALFLGIIGAVMFRFAFFYGFGTLLHLTVWARRILGAFLIFSGFMALLDDDGEFDAKDSVMVRALRWCLGDRLKESYNSENGGGLFFYDADKTRASLLLLVVLVLEFTDIVFAIDSVSAKIVQIPDIYLSLSSSVVAMFGLRATFYIVEDIINAFELLKYGICIVLVFIGLELVLSPLIAIPPGTVCAMFASIFAICIAASIIRKGRGEAAEQEREQAEGSKNPQEDEDTLPGPEDEQEDLSSSSKEPLLSR